MRILLCLILSAWSVAAATTNSITQHGITWYFDDTVTYGTFANGDYWVVGPVTITNINPACVTTNGITVNGAQVDPIGHATQTLAMSAQGYDSRMYQGNLGTNYSESLNVANDLPLTLDGPNSLISVISRPAQSAYSQLDTAAVLTVLTNAITDGGAYFRPPYCGVGFKPLFSTNDINWSLLRTLAVVTNTPTFNSVETNFIRVWLEQNTGSANQSMHPLNNQLNYSAYNARNTQAGLLLLHLNYTIAQKKDLCIRLIQLGIDNYGVARSGGVFIDLEGLNTGCKAPVVFAATMLNDADMKGWANGTTNLIFSDDRQIWYVTASDTNRSLSSKNGQAPEQYLAGDIGTAEWGGQHLNYPQFDGRQWDRIYRSIAGVSLVGAALAMQLTEGSETIWNYPPFFDYYDRFYDVEESYDFTYDASHVISLFIRGMWENYRTLGDLYTPTIVTNNASGARVMGFRGLGMSVLPIPSVNTTADLWQAFEFTDPTVANLDANDNTSTGTWLTNDNTVLMSISTSGERALTGTINGSSDTGHTRGLRKSHTANDTANVQFDLGGSAVGTISAGTWWKFVGPTPGASKCILLFAYSGGTVAEVVMNITTKTVGFSGGSNNGVALVTDTWYWITAKIVKNSTSYISVYDTTGTLVGTEVAGTAANQDTRFISLGRGLNETADNSILVYWDDLVLDWTDATYPLGL